MKFLFTIVLVSLILSSKLPAQAEDFSIVVLPDTQHASRQFPEVFINQTEWVVENKENRSILFVLHEGDIVNRGDSRRYQWDNADAAMSLLDEVVPYTLSVGNHDMGTGNAENRDTNLYNEYFPYTRYESEPWYGGHMGDSNDNHFTFFYANGMRFIIVTLEFGPNSEVIVWANKVLKRYPDYRAIILTHCYMNHDNTRVGPGDRYNPHDYDIDDIDDPHDGEEMWETLVKLHKNIFLVLSGHILNDGTGRLTSIGDNSNKVHQILANYQREDNGGNGWLRILTFSLQEDTIHFETYSPWLDEFRIDEENEFTLSYDMIFGDGDGDNDVDLFDFQMFLSCLEDFESEEIECSIFDIDGDNDTDMVDFSVFQLNFTG